MHAGRAWTSSLGVQHLLLARLVGWVVTLRPTHGVWFVVSRPSVALGTHLCAVSWTTLLLSTGVPVRCVALRVWCPCSLDSCSPVCPLGVLCRVCGVLGHSTPVHHCARSVRCLAYAVSWATWLLFTDVLARRVVLCVQCPEPLGSRSPVCPLAALSCVCGVAGHLAPVHRCVCLARCVACAVSRATWLLFTGVLARCVVLRVRCRGPLDYSSPVCSLCVLCCVCGVLGHSVPVHWCARSVHCIACVRCPGPVASCSPVCPVGVLCRMCGVLGPMTAVQRCACSVRCFACAVSWVSWLLLTGVLARRVVLPVRCPGPLGSCSPVCPFGLLCWVCGVLGQFAPVPGCARLVCCVVVRCSGPLGSCSPVCPLGALSCVCVVVGDLAPVHRCVRSMRCGACVRCPGLLGSCSLVGSLGAMCCVCGVLGHLDPVHRCARSVCCVACALSWATWLLFSSAHACCVVLFSGVLGHLAPVHLVNRSVCSVACALSWAPWLLFSGVLARPVVLRAQFSWPLGSCSPVCSLAVLCCELCVRCPGPLGSCSPG